MFGAKTQNVTANMMIRMWQSWTPLQRSCFLELLAIAIASHQRGLPEMEVLAAMSVAFNAITKGQQS